MCSSGKKSVIRACLGLAVIGLALVTSAQETAPADTGRNPAQVVLFHQHPEDFKGGRQLAVTVYISALKWDGLTAMGLYESIPQGWTFSGARAIAGAMPGVMPSKGDSGVLEFMWIEQATAPITFQYLLDIPPAEGGTRVLSGQVEYRQGEGAMLSNVAMSQVAGFPDAAPTLTLRGSEVVSLTVNTPFNDPGAGASDPEDGNLDNRVEVSGAVDTSTPGDYTLTYGVADSVGNRAEPVSRTVRVSEGTEPGTSNPDTPDPGTGPALPGDGMASRPDPAGRSAGQVDLQVPGISVPEVNLKPRTGGFDLPMKDESASGEEAAAEGESGHSADSATRLAAVAGAGERPGSGGRGEGSLSGALGGGEWEGAQAPGRAGWPLVLFAVPVIVLAAGGIFWGHGRAGFRRRPGPRG